MTSVSYRDFTGTGAENYERYFVPAIATPVSRHILEAAAIQPGERVLDVACGTGLIARLAAERVAPGGSVTGVDLAPDMIEVAKASSPEVDWRVADATDLPLEDDSFDVVLCQMGLMFMEDKPGALEEMRRVVTPGGRVVVSTPGRINDLFAAMEAAIVRHINPDLGGFVRAVFSMHDPGMLHTLLGGAGLTNVSARVTTVTLRLPAPAEFLWQYINLTPMGPIVAAAPEESKNAMEREVVEAWARHVVDGRTVVDQDMLTASGRG